MDTGTIVSSFRWHADSLTVDDRTTNIAESVYYMVEGRTFTDERRKADTTDTIQFAVLATH